MPFPAPETHLKATIAIADEEIIAHRKFRLAAACNELL
jgi:hypothetical protein